MDQAAGQADDQNTTETAKPRRVWWVLLGVILVVAVVVVGWLVTASAVRNDVLVTQTRPIDCEGAVVVHQIVATDQPAMDVIHAKPGMTCTLEIRYDNTSARSVHLSTATFALFGPSAELLGTMPDAVDTGHRTGGEATDATFRVDVTLPAGATLIKQYRIVWNPHGCSDGIAWISQLPTISVSAMGLSGDVHGSVALGVSGHYNGCPDS